jgi:hypothetical protein
VRLDWLDSAEGFLGRPPLRGASGRNVNCSSLATNSGDPSGRPVCVDCRRAVPSAAASPSARNRLHSLSVHRLLHRCISNIGSGLPAPQWAPALDHLHNSAAAAIPARTGFNST